MNEREIRNHHDRLSSSSLIVIVDEESFSTQPNGRTYSYEKERGELRSDHWEKEEEDGASDISYKIYKP